MSLLDKIERKLGRFALPHVTEALIACQVISYLALRISEARQGQPSLAERLLLIPERVLAGEVWRVVTFLILPPTSNILFAFFFWYLFYLMGTALERHWGTFRYNIYLLIGYLATVGVSFLTPDQPSSNAFLQGSVFLAFAFLYPDFELRLFFILPVKIKWLALIAWIGYFLAVVFGDWVTRLLVVASVCNFLLFFGRDILERIQTGRRRMARQAAQLNVKEPTYYHRCTVCGITDRTHPRMEFRYCSQCAGTHGYCMDHLKNHEHILETENAAEK